MESTERRIYLSVAVEIGYGRGILRGVARFGREQDNWRTVAIDSRDMNPEFLEKEKPAGVIAMLSNEQPAVAWLLEHGVPAVNVSGRAPAQKLPMVISDNQAIGRMAAEHFVDRGFRTFGFVGYDLSFSDERYQGFQTTVAEHGFAVNRYPHERTKDGDPNRERYGRPGEWLSTLEPPIGVLCCNDHRGAQIVDAALHGGLRVPEDVAVLGVDDDEVRCELATVPLSSVAPNAERIGRVAGANMLDMLEGRPPSAQVTLVEPASVTVRSSTDVLAYADEDIKKAVRYIERHACDPISVADVVNEVKVSRRTLEYRFREYLGRSPREEIERVRFERARRLLADPTLNVREVARQVGFFDARRFSKLFRSRHNLTPTKFREQEENQ